MTTQTGTVFVVDDDEAVRDSLSLLMEAESLSVECFSSPIEFLERCPDDRPGCLLLDVRMPQMSGLELRDELQKRGSMMPIVFITGHGDVPMAVHAMQEGAIDFIQKPFRDQDLIDRIHQGIVQDRRIRQSLSDRKAITERIGSLTPRERQVMQEVVDGKANKVIAFELGLSERTVEIHRSRVMSKMGAESLAQLVRMVVRAQDGSG